MEDRTVRRSQTVAPFGVGAVIDMLGESFIAEDIRRWQGKRHILRAPRIAQLFGVSELQTPAPVDEKGSGLPYYRFPEWLFCGNCRRMTKWGPKMEVAGKAPQCGRCSKKPQLVPMRFVAVCEDGHISDVEWRGWAHSQPQNRDQRQCGETDLSFVHVEGVGGGLDSVAVRCNRCSAKRSLESLPSPGALKSARMFCRGLQPWQLKSEAEKCNQALLAVQRGASSVYYPNVGSAIDIPPESNWDNWGGPAARIAANNNFKFLLTGPDPSMVGQLVAMTAIQEKVSESLVREILAQTLGTTSSTGIQEDSDDIESREWAALTEPPAGHDSRDNFISRSTPFPHPEGHDGLQPLANQLDELFEKVVLVKRLREVRVLRSFSRHKANRQVTPDLGKKTDFLPAIEVFGEGIFVEFSEAALAAWENSQTVSHRVKRLRQRLGGTTQSKWIDFDVEPRLILLHTFAHLLLRQTAFDAGYSSSSLRERIYSSTGDESRAGVLIYTAAGDSEGTMGGLSRLGEADRLVPIIASALSAADWCSLDPVCAESEAQGSNGLSMAACHACALASETSCVLGNILLDRRTLIDPEFGFFATAMQELRVGIGGEA